MSILATYIMPHPPLVVPAVGRGQEKQVQATLDACRKAAEEMVALAPETIIVISPHSIMYADYIHISPGAGASGSFKQFGAPGEKWSVTYDEQLVSALSAIAGENGIYAGTLGEKDKSLDHGVLVPLYFIEKAYKGLQMPKFVRISLSGLSVLEHYRFGQVLREAIEDQKRKVVIVASGDLSHRLKEEGSYSFAEEGPVFDGQIVEVMKTGDFMKLLTIKEEFAEAAGECGLRSFVIMAGALDSQAVKAEFYSYEGTFGVGYGVAGFKPIGPDPERDFGRQYEQYKQEYLARCKAGEDALVRLARLSLETCIRQRKPLQYSEEMLRQWLAQQRDGQQEQQQETLFRELAKTRAGTFVSLKKDGKLRGCIGTISPVEKSLAEEIIRNAVSAGIGDPRFDPVGEDELDELVYSVDVLGGATPIQSKTELDVKKYGVIVRKGKKSGLLLPNLEGVTSIDQQVEIALQKAGIPLHEDYSMERFEVVRHAFRT